MRKLLVALAAAALAAGPVAADEKTEVADYTFKKKGKPVKETGSMITLALQKGEAGWRITGWAWAKH